MRRPLLAGLLLSLACADDVDHHSTGTGTGTATGTTTLDAPPPEPQGVDSSGATEVECIDDYHGHDTSLTALALALDTTDEAVVSLGDGHAATPAELGSDELVVCATTPSDFFSLQTPCPAYLVLEVRSLEGDVPDLLLHDDAGQLVAHAAGEWFGFFLKPMLHHVAPGTHMIEVRHAGADPQRYSLAVMMLPGPTCGP